jgi:hypothetical protein
MAELGVLRFKSSRLLMCITKEKRIGSKPSYCLSEISGNKKAWNTTTYQNLLTNFYRGDVVDKVVVSGLIMIVSLHWQPKQLNGTSPSADLFLLKLKKDPEGSSTQFPRWNHWPGWIMRCVSAQWAY